MGGLLSRRDFLGTTAAAGGMLLAGGLAARPLAAAEEAGWPKMPPVTIRVVYVGLGGAWPKPEFDAKAEVAKFQTCLDGVRQRLGDVEFVGGDLIPNSDQAAAELAGKIGTPDALLLIHLAFGSGHPLLGLVNTGLPTAIFSQPFSGHDWMYVPQWQKAGKRVVLVASSDTADLERAVALLREPARMRQSRILLVGGAHRTAAARTPAKIRERLGSPDSERRRRLGFGAAAAAGIRSGGGGWDSERRRRRLGWGGGGGSRAAAGIFRILLRASRGNRPPSRRLPSRKDSGRARLL